MISYMYKVISSEEEYQSVLAAVTELVLQDPDPGTAEADRLELLILLVQDYESRSTTIDTPDPIEAILFRMEQQNLKQKDLIPIIGSKSKVSEILSRKRPLTLSMIRALNGELGIPATVLLREPTSAKYIEEGEEISIEWKQFPLKEMMNRRWLDSFLSRAKGDTDLALRYFVEAAGPAANALVLYKRTKHIRSKQTMNEHALRAWTIRVILKAQENPLGVPFDREAITLDFMRKVVQLSWSDEGPKLAQEYLGKHGIPLIIEPHLQHTLLDGSAILVNPENPIIGMTIRHDRLDNFWFCLMHELAHIALHSDGSVGQFYDDLDDHDDDPREAEADEMASEALIPHDVWITSPASKLKSPDAAEHLARKMGIHPAIVAGKIRHEFKAYKLLNNLIGQKQVRRCFNNVVWEK